MIYQSMQMYQTSITIVFYIYNLYTNDYIKNAMNVY